MKMKMKKRISHKNRSKHKESSSISRTISRILAIGHTSTLDARSFEMNEDLLMYDVWCFMMYDK